ncbi:MAG TPA: hypothetical protein PKC18_00830 [Lacipirellulaceae bacterium]|nr:hypothetical protein [Lacipirellulaceae bacterium]
MMRWHLETMLDLYRRAAKTRHPDDVNDFAEALIPYVLDRVTMELTRKNLRHDPELIDELVAGSLSKIVAKINTILSRELKTNSALRGYLRTIVRREVPILVDWCLRSCGVGPSERTRARRIANGQEPYRLWDLQHRGEYFDEHQGMIEHEDGDDDARYTVDQDAPPDRGDAPGQYRDDNWPGSEDDEWCEWAAWVVNAACRFADADPRVRKALDLACDSRDEPCVAEIARSVGMKRRTLADRLRRIGEQVAASAPEWVDELGRRFLGETWISAAESGAHAVRSNRKQAA